MKGIIIALAMVLTAMSATAVDIITDPIDVNITAHEADSLFADYRGRIVNELNHVGLFPAERVETISNMKLTINGGDVFSALNAAIDALNADYEKTWASLDGSFVSLMSAADYWKYLAGGEGSQVTNKPEAWKLTHRSMTTFMFSTNDVELELTIEPADKKYPKGIILNLSGSKCLTVADALVATSAPNPSSPNCIWFINAVEDPSSLVSVIIDESNQTDVYDLLGRRASSTYRGIKIASHKLIRN